MQQIEAFSQVFFKMFYARREKHGGEGQTKGETGTFS